MEEKKKKKIIIKNQTYIGQTSEVHYEFDEEREEEVITELEKGNLPKGVTKTILLNPTPPEHLNEDKMKYFMEHLDEFYNPPKKEKKKKKVEIPPFIPPIDTYQGVEEVELLDNGEVWREIYISKEEYNDYADMPELEDLEQYDERFRMLSPEERILYGQFEKIRRTNFVGKKKEERKEKGKENKKNNTLSQDAEEKKLPPQEGGPSDSIGN